MAYLIGLLIDLELISEGDRCWRGVRPTAIENSQGSAPSAPPGADKLRRKTLSEAEEG